MRRAAALLGLIFLLALPERAAAQTTPPERHEPFHLYLGMWTTHLKDEKIRLDPNNAIGFSYRHFFAATFTNSFDKRAYGAGVQKEFLRGNKGVFSAALGGRLGGIYGYDERFIKLAGDLAVLPMAQAYALFEVGRIGAEVSYTYVVVSVTGSIRFGR